MCEDLQQEVLVRRFLLRIGFGYHQIRIEKSPGAGSAEQFVRERYPEEVIAHRSRATHLDLRLIVVTDADVGTVDDRHRQLDAKLREVGQKPRAADERIMLLVPRRNVETWIHYLRGNPVDEETVYPRLERERDCQPAVDRLVKIHRSEPPEDCHPSLVRALDELKRL